MVNKPLVPDELYLYYVFCAPCHVHVKLVNFYSSVAGARTTRGDLTASGLQHQGEGDQYVRGRR